MKKRLLLLLLLLTLLLPAIVRAQTTDEAAETVLVPIGGGYADIYGGLVQTYLTRAAGSDVHILVVAATYSSSAESITPGERATNLQDADRRRYEIEQACLRAAPPGITCTAVVLPVFTRDDALNPANLAYFTPELNAIFFLGGDQTVAMRALANTPIETALAEAYARGAVISGTSAGCGLQAANMLADYSSNASAGTGLNFGAAQVWNTPEQHGLSFALQNAILDQHFFQRGRVGRLLEAISRPDVPHIGIGVDAYTGVHIFNGNRVQDVFGLYSVAVFDAQTYHAADSVRYVGEQNTLSLRNVLVHILSEGAQTYDLTERRHSLGAAAPTVIRDFAGLALPEGAGSLWFAGGIEKSLSAPDVLPRFLEAAGGSQAKILVFVQGYNNPRTNQRIAEKYAAALQALGAQTIALSPADDGSLPPLPALEEVTGILLAGRDPSLMTPPDWATAYWQAGLPVLADAAAAVQLGAFYSAHGPHPEDAEALETATQKAFQQGVTVIVPGLNWLPVTLEPEVMTGNRWARLFSLAYNHPDLLALGISDASALEITPDGAWMRGESPLITLDLSTATLGLGTTNGFEIANALLDVFAPGELVAPVDADSTATPQHQPTPALVLPSPSPTDAPPTATAQPTPQPAAPTATLNAGERLESPPAVIAAAPAAPAAPSENSPLLWLGLLAAGGLLFFGGWIWRTRR